MTYKLQGEGVLRADGVFIPNDPENRDWQEFQAWVAAGNTPAAADPAVVVVPTLDQKLAMVGLTVAELKQALGVA